MTVQVENQEIRLKIYDTAGQERYGNLTSSYCRGAHGIIIVYDCTSHESFEKIENWNKFIQNSIDPNDVSILLCCV